MGIFSEFLHLDFTKLARSEEYVSHAKLQDLAARF
jgi:hypothetical protein